MPFLQTQSEKKQNSSLQTQNEKKQNSSQTQNEKKQPNKVTRLICHHFTIII